MKNYVRICIMALLVVTLVCTAVACSSGTEEDTEPHHTLLTETAEPTSGEETPVTTPDGETVTPGEQITASDVTAAEDTTPTEPTTIKLTFSGQGLTGAPEGSVVVEGGAFVIVKAGTYELTGDLSNGQVCVRVEKTNDITLILNNFTASSATTAPLYIASANNCVIELAAGSVNRLSDAAAYVYDNPSATKPNACLYSSDDLTIKGSGSLIIQGNYNNGIGCKNDLKIKNGTITVSAPNNIIKGGNSVTVSGGNITLSGGEDAIKTDSEAQGKGFILISKDANLDITCADDVLQASQSVTVESTARVTYTAGGDPVNCPGVITVAEGSMVARTAE